MTRHWILALALIGVVIAVVLSPPIPQDPGYHSFADQRTMIGIPNALNVVSNVPFAFIGLAGLSSRFADLRASISRGSGGPMRRCLRGRR